VISLDLSSTLTCPRTRWFAAAQALRLDEYGLEEGHPADIVFLAAGNALEALRLQPIDRIVVRNGRLVSRRRQKVLTNLPT
jgi:cytosine/adenosine deaminase-related metal-dependent hydrolase